MIENHSSEELVDINSQQVVGSIDSIMDALSLVKDVVVQHKFTKSTRFNVLGMAKSYFDDLMKNTGSSEDEDQKKDATRKIISELHQEIERLQEISVKDISLDSASFYLNEYANSVSIALEEIGFDYIKKTVILGNHGYSQLALEISLHDLDENKLKLDYHQSLVKDNDNNKKALLSKITDKYPNIYIESWRCQNISNEMCLTSLFVRIPLKGVFNV